MTTSTRRIVAGNDIQDFHVSADGRFVSYVRETGNSTTLYVTNLGNGSTATVDTAPISVAFGADYLENRISATGQYIAYLDRDQHLVFKDLQSGSSAVITPPADRFEGEPIPEGISASGRYVVYLTSLNDGKPNTAGASQFVVHDKSSGTDTTIGPAATVGGIAPHGSLTPDGHYFAYTINARLILTDISTFTTLLDEPAAFVGTVKISNDGRYIAYDRLASNTAESQVYLHDMQNPGTPDAIVSTAADGSVANDRSSLAGFSGDGRHLEFLSNASNLVAGDASGTPDTFIKSLDTGAVQKTSAGGYLSYDGSTTVSVGQDGIYQTVILPPSITIGAIAGDDVVNALEEDIFPITVSGTSDTPGAHITVTSPNGAQSTTTVLNNGFWATTVSGSGVSDGPHDFTVTANDDLGYARTATHGVTYDGTPPFISYNLNDKGGINAAQLHASTIAGQSDAVGQVASFTIDGKAIGQATIGQPTATSGSFGAYSLGFDASVFDDGVHTLGVTVADAAGNVTSETSRFFIVTTPPPIAITSIAGDDVVGSREIDGLVPIFGTSGAIGQTVQIALGDTILGTAIVGSNGIWSADISLSGAPAHAAVVASVADVVGNVGEDSETVLVDSNVIRVSVAADGSEGENLPNSVFGLGFRDSSVSADGRYVLFSTDAVNTLSDGSSHQRQALIKDVLTGALTTLPVTAYGAEISQDGHHVVFLNGDTSLYEVRDLATGTVRTVDVSADGEVDNGPATSDRPSISADGRFVVFTSDATNLIPGLTTLPPDQFGDHVYVKDMESGTVTLVSFNQSDQYQTDYEHSHIAGGRYVAFQTAVPGFAYDTNGTFDIYLRDLETQDVTLISKNVFGYSGNGSSFAPEVSADGRYVAFISTASDLVPSTQTGEVRAYLYDRQTDTITLLSAAADGTPLESFIAPSALTLSADGRYVGLPIGQGGPPPTIDYYVRDTSTGAVQLASTGTRGFDRIETQSGRITPDGHYLAFTSFANDVVAGDTNQMPDVFLRNLRPDSLTLDPIAGDDRVTPAERSATQRVGGTTTETSGTVSVTLDGTAIATASVAANGVWSTTIDTTGLTSGGHLLTATIVDPLGFSASDGSVVQVDPLPAAGTRTLTLRVSEDAYHGDAQFVVRVDGQQVGGVQTVTAPHGAAMQDIVVLGAFGSHLQDVVVEFVNDLYGGTPTTDRNLYVDKLFLDGGVYEAELGAVTRGKILPGEAEIGATGGTLTFKTGTGIGLDTLVVHGSEDAYQGDAQFVVRVDGQQIGGAQTMTASHAAAQSQDVTLHGDFGVDPHNVTIEFLNDLYGGMPSTDRNLYIDTVTLNGAVYEAELGAVTLGKILPGEAEIGATGGTLTVKTGTGIGLDTLVVRGSEDAYQGDTQFVVRVDGHQIGGIQTLTASHAAAQSQDVTLHGDFGVDPHNVTIEFLNDLYRGTPQTDRNLYIDTVTLNGAVYEAELGAVTLGKILPGEAEIGATGGTVSIPIGAGAGPDVLAFKMSEDAYQGDALFLVKVDGAQLGGVQTVTTLHSSGQYQDVVLHGDFDDNPHQVQVQFLNDLYDGTPQTDRNLYIDQLVFNGHVYEAEHGQVTLGRIDPTEAQLGATNGTLTFDHIIG